MPGGIGEVPLTDEKVTDGVLSRFANGGQFSADAGGRGVSETLDVV